MSRSRKVIYLFVFALTFGAGPLFADSYEEVESVQGRGKELDLKSINKEIESLERLKEHYVARATRLRNRADRLQFNSEENGLISAQKYWKEANESDRIADQIQEKIDSLEEEREFVKKQKPY